MEINKLMRFLIPPLLAVSLAGCARAEVPQMFTSPVFICHDPDITPNTPFQIVMVQVIVDKNNPHLYYNLLPDHLLLPQMPTVALTHLQWVKLLTSRPESTQ